MIHELDDRLAVRAQRADGDAEAHVVGVDGQLEVFAQRQVLVGAPHGAVLRATHDEVRSECELVGAETGDFTIGVSETTYFDAGDGISEYVDTESFFVPRAGSRPTAAIRLDRGSSRNDGSLISATHVEAYDQEAEPRDDLALAYRKGQWVVSGRYDGEAIEEILRAPKRIDSRLGQSLAIERWPSPAGSRDKTHLRSWIPSLDPKRLTEFEIENVESDGSRVVLRIDGDEDARTEAERNHDGRMIRGIQHHDGAEFAIETIYFEGELPK